MLLRSLLFTTFAAIIAIVLGITPSDLSIPQQSSQSSSSVASTNATGTYFGVWPRSITKPLGGGISIKILNPVPYRPSVPVSEDQMFEILAIIETMETKAQRQVPITSTVTVTVRQYSDMSGPVIFEMESEDHYFGGAQIAGMLRTVWGMMLDYGSPASVSAELMIGAKEVGIFKVILIDTTYR